MDCKYYFHLKRYSSILLVLVVLFSCKDDEITKTSTTSDDVPTSFSFLAKDNPSIYQDIVFTKQADFSFAANVVHEVDLSNIKPTFDYNGVAKMNGKLISSGITTMTFPDEFIIQFDNKNVIFHVNRYYTIPTMYITTENNEVITSKTEYVKCSVRIDSKNMYNDFATEATDPAEIRGRGNSTWEFYDKKPYRLKLGSKKELLGMGAAKSWVLLANYRDPTNFMNAVVFDMARYMQMPYTNTNRFVEVYLNNKYIGMYQFTEQVQQGNNRVEIDETAGVLLNLDLDDGPEYSPDTDDNFNSSVYNLPIAVKHPEALTAVQIDAIKSDFAVVEQLIKQRDFAKLSKRLDIQSMIDFLIIQEMTRNVELVSPRSMYMYKDADNIYHFGPVWDFDGGFSFDWASMTNGHGYFGSQSWLMGSSNPSTHPPTAYNYISGFFVNMFANAEFSAAYKTRWAEVQSGMLNYCFTQLDDNVLHCDAAMVNNAKRWPIGKGHKVEIEKLKNWLTTRASNYSNVVKNY